jgi:hypothetical protein
MHSLELSAMAVPVKCDLRTGHPPPVPVRCSGKQVCTGWRLPVGLMIVVLRDIRRSKTGLQSLRALAVIRLNASVTLWYNRGASRLAQAWGDNLVASVP